MKLPEPKTHKLAGLEWRENYGCYSFQHSCILKLEFNYTSDGYKMSINGRELKWIEKDPEQAGHLHGDGCQAMVEKHG